MRKCNLLEKKSILVNSWPDPSVVVIVDNKVSRTKGPFLCYSQTPIYMYWQSLLAENVHNIILKKIKKIKVSKSWFVCFIVWFGFFLSLENVSFI